MSELFTFILISPSSCGAISSSQYINVIPSFSIMKLSGIYISVCKYIFFLQAFDIINVVLIVEFI